MKIIGLVGLVGSGKDTAAAYLKEQYGYRMVSMGDIVRDLATQLGRSHNRDDLQRTQKEYRDKYGDEYFGGMVVKKITASGWDKVVINGLRIPADVAVPKRGFGKDMTVIYIDVPAAVRFERMKSRKRIGDPETLEEFERQENNELKLFNFDGVLAYVDYKLSNSGTLPELQTRIDEFIRLHNLS
ncbi:MAG: AAA family ATPase [Candidatus Aenigmarchaeota archaeon]|nr:AAA family ATPase [Candidatus Aenigmarchaeota archaeon]